MESGGTESLGKLNGEISACLAISHHQETGCQRRAHVSPGRPGYLSGADVSCRHASNGLSRQSMEDRSFEMTLRYATFRLRPILQPRVLLFQPCGY